MKEESKSQLDNYLKKYYETRYDSEKELSDKKQRDKKFFKLYENIIMNNIIPVMKEFSNYLESKGHDTVIGNHFENKAIFMNIYPEKIRNDSHPSISFMAESEEQRISVHTKSFMPDNGGSEKFLGEFELTDITKEFVEEEIVNLIKQSFSNYREPENYNKISSWR